MKIMEAKDTVRTYNELKVYCEEKGIALPIQPNDLKLAAAEISFKAGMEYCREQDPEKWDNLDGMLANERKASIKEVVEWTRNNGYLIDGHTPGDLKRLKAKLKEWGIK